jgi:hypothetical protein
MVCLCVIFRGWDVWNTKSDEELICELRVAWSKVFPTVAVMSIPADWRFGGSGWPRGSASDLPVYINLLPGLP